ERVGEYELVLLAEPPESLQVLALLRRQLVVDGRGEVDRALARPRLRLVKETPAFAPHDRLRDARHAALDDQPARLEGFERVVGVLGSAELARANPRQDREPEAAAAGLAPGGLGQR